MNIYIYIQRAKEPESRRQFSCYAGLTKLVSRISYETWGYEQVHRSRHSEMGRVGRSGGRDKGDEKKLRQEAG